MLRLKGNRIVVIGLLGLSFALSVNLISLGQQERLPEELYQDIAKSCIGAMKKNVVSDQVAKAYCYCYAEALNDTMREEDFARIDTYGVSEHDQRRFEAARKRCKPSRGFF
jgi:hypothetical protein